MDILKYFKLTPFIKKYLPHINNVKYKLSGKNSSGKPYGFSPQEQAEIMAEIEKLLEQSKNK
ncbi:hypothetical protein VF04_38020 [Nostoc linckia z7]|uniref:Uncharacterized protein n=1 Tax=Nostoc linckia z7 TaxID=1628745 RepID=A0ABX4KBL1_NOSLI|nr:hypothetical protein VF02_37905 [Nostoc linckia z1]PHJ59262.1 hypothetical protein VF05_32230 [Nostoc linckia z3]PHJ63657.1 hypothetical protein VF03_30105 [Nostoc linckia z2]PHJ73881.1 hypothetical protein VF06_35785 [Nostoc linckia z4]PHJ80154.1 hypothetical protein VF04_38020 [Nostoc linckia z7]